MAESKSLDFVASAGKNAQCIYQTTAKVAEGVSTIVKKHKTLVSASDKLPVDSDSRRVKIITKEIESKLEKLGDDTDQLKQSLEILSAGWSEFKTSVSKRPQPYSTADVQSMVAKLEELQEENTLSQELRIPVQEALSTVLNLSSEANGICSSAEGKAKEKEATSKLVGAVAASALGGAAVVAGLGAAVAVAGKAAAIAAGTMGVGAVAAGGVTYTLSERYSKMAQEFSDSKNLFHAWNSDVSATSTQLATLERETIELIKCLQVGHKLQSDALETKKQLEAVTQKAELEAVKQKAELEAEKQKAELERQKSELDLKKMEFEKQKVEFEKQKAEAEAAKRVKEMEDENAKLKRQLKALNVINRQNNN